MSLNLLLRGQFRYMRDHGFDVITVSSDGKEVSALLEEGAQHVAIPMTRKMTPLKDLKALWKLVRALKKIQPDIVHTHTPKAGLLGMLAARICRVPIRLHTVAGLPLTEARGMKRWIFEITEQLTYACAHVVYPNSLGLKAFIEKEFKVAQNKIKVIGRGSSNGIDINFFDRTPLLEQQARDIRMQYAISTEDLVFSFVGRVVRDKGITELIHSFKKISDIFSRREPGKKIFLLVVGPLEADLDPLPPEVLSEAMNDNGIIFTGFQDDVRPWIMASDVFVFPSYREGFPNVVMQASLLQVPCIVTNIPGCNEIVQDGVTGIIVPSKNVESLLCAMEELVNSQRKRKEYGVAARQYVMENFKREFVWEELRKEYNRHLASKT